MDIVVEIARHRDRIVGLLAPFFYKRGELLPALSLETSPDTLDFGARVYRTSNQTISNGTWTAISFDAERFDIGNMHTSSNPTTLIAPRGGIYVISGTVNWAQNNNGNRYLGIRLNGNTWLDIIGFPPLSTSHDMTITTIYQLSAGDYVELCVYQNSGGNLDIRALGNYSPEFSIARIMG